MHSRGWHLVSRDKLSHFPLELRLNDCKISYGRPWGCLPFTGTRRPASACVYTRVCVLCTCVSISTHAHTHTHRPCQRRRRAVILMEAECYFILPLVTAVRRAAGRERESTPSAESLARPTAPTPRTRTGPGITEASSLLILTQNNG